MVEPQRSIVRFDEASLGRDEPQTNRTRGKAREKPHRHPHGELLLDNADAVIDALRRCAEHARQLGGESPLLNLMEVKS